MSERRERTRERSGASGSPRATVSGSPRGEAPRLSKTRLIESSSAQLRLDEAYEFAREHTRHGDVWLVGASRGAVDDLSRRVALETGAAIGLHRFSLPQLAARLAA